jgi:hypothetical protein
MFHWPTNKTLQKSSVSPNIQPPENNNAAFPFKALAYFAYF